ncbi:hypothetical protein [Asticcacaulis solisilvae]|uniref:hypothetical protein n=1 Tax=Asticcacaulis solisilvae TaxID=1217274 RepID=UPI003FD8D816
MAETSTHAMAARVTLAAVSLAVAVACGLGAWQLAAPLSAPAVFPFSETFYVRSAAAQKPADAIGWALRATQVAPARPENWLLLAHAYHVADGYLSTRTVNAIRTSYAVGALSPNAHEWRLAYVYTNWGAMPRDIQVSARNEILTYSTRGAGRAYLRKLLAMTTDPDARLGLGALMLRRQTEDQLHDFEMRRNSAR